MYDITSSRRRFWFFFFFFKYIAMYEASSREGCHRETEEYHSIYWWRVCVEQRQYLYTIYDFFLPPTLCVNSSLLYICTQSVYRSLSCGDKRIYTKIFLYYSPIFFFFLERKDIWWFFLIALMLNGFQSVFFFYPYLCCNYCRFARERVLFYFWLMS